MQRQVRNAPFENLLRGLISNRVWLYVTPQASVFIITRDVFEWDHLWKRAKTHLLSFWFILWMIPFRCLKTWNSNTCEKNNFLLLCCLCLSVKNGVFHLQAIRRLEITSWILIIYRNFQGHRLGLCKAAKKDFFCITGLLTYNPQTIKSTLVKCKIQWFFIYSQSRDSIALCPWGHAKQTPPGDLAFPFKPSPLSRLPPPKLLTTTPLLSVVLDLPILDISHKETTHYVACCYCFFPWVQQWPGSSVL